MRFEQAIAIHAAPERIWRVWMEAERWPDWTASMQQVQRLTPGRMGVGSEFRITQPGMAPANWRVADLQEGRSFAWVSHAPAMRVYAGHAMHLPEAAAVTQLAAGGGAPTITVTLTVEFSGPLGLLVGRLFRTITLRFMAIEAEGLKARCEAPG